MDSGGIVWLAVQLAEQPAGHHVPLVADKHAADAVHVAVVHPWPAEDQPLGPDSYGAWGVQL